MKPILQFLIGHFPDLLSLNVTASIVILFVICVRQFLKGVPKIFSYALWGIVLLRLLVPFSIESPVSFVPARTEFSSIVEVNEILPEIQFETPSDRADNEWRVENTPSEEVLVQTYHTADAETYLTFAWIAGIAGMLIYSAVSYIKLRRRVQIAIPLCKGIYLCGEINSPFVMGIFRPVVYLPDTLDDFEREYIIAHERHHIRRGDHIFKMLGFLALTIHWFNPFVWLAFMLASRDMEMSCDEAVIRKLGEEVRADYSTTLLNLASGHRLFTGTPLAFGEDDPAGRVRNLAKWKKPAIWVIVICILVCVVLAVCLLTDPEDKFDWSITRQEGASCVLGDFNYTAPAGLAVQGTELAHNGNAWDIGNVFYVGDTLVGGLALRYQNGESGPELFTTEWEQDIGVPEASEKEMAYFGGSSAYADYEITYFPDFPVKYDDHGEIIPDENGTYVIENEVTHYFFLNGDDVYDLWFYDNRLSTDMQIELLKSAYIQPPTKTSDWGIALFPERVSRTGATATFSIISGSSGERELTYGDFLSLERLENGEWVEVEELPGFSYYVGDAIYPVADGYGMVHEWPDRFGELPDGTYRMGKRVTCHHTDGTTEEQMVYGQFTLPNDIHSNPIPLEDLPEKYSAEQAMIDGCFVQTDGIARENKDLFRQFAADAQNGTPSFIRIVNWHYGENSQCTVADLSFDGNVYTLTTKSDTYTYRYLKRFAGEKAWKNADHDGFEYYVLLSDDAITWEEFSGGKLNSQNLDHWTVFADFTYRADTLQLPANLAQATLKFRGDEFATTTDFDRLEKLYLLFADAEFLGYEPKTHSIGVMLDLILTTEDGKTVVIELDPDNDLCRIGGEYVFYGKAEEPCYIEKLWYYLDIPSWPDAVYASCENAFRPLGVG